MVFCRLATSSKISRVKNGFERLWAILRSFCSLQLCFWLTNSQLSRTVAACVCVWGVLPPTTHWPAGWAERQRETVCSLPQPTSARRLLHVNKTPWLFFCSRAVLKMWGLGDDNTKPVDKKRHSNLYWVFDQTPRECLRGLNSFAEGSEIGLEQGTERRGAGASGSSPTPPASGHSGRHRSCSRC